MATTGHESEVINVSGLKNTLQKMKTDLLTSVPYYVTSASGTAGSTASGSYNRTQWTGNAAGISALATGAMVLLKIPVAGCKYGVSLNINGLGEHPVVLNVNTMISTLYAVGAILPLVYDADQKASIYVSNTNTEYTGCWKIANYDSNTTYTPLALGFCTGQCDTAAGTAAKAVTMSSYTLVAHGIVSIKFTHAITVASATLNINTKGAKAIYYKGAALAANVIEAGDIVTMQYNGTQYVIIGIVRASGIPKSDLASAVQASLGKADSALQSHQDISGKADKSATVSTVSYTSKKITKTINGTTTDVVTASTIVTDGGGLKSHQTIKQDGITGATVNRFGTCSTAAGTAAKTVTITSGTFSLEAGASVRVKFSNANTAGTPTLNVYNGSTATGAKNIFHNGSKITTGGNKALLAGVCDFVYDGTQYHLVGNYIDTTYSSQSAASGGTAVSLCTTGEKYTWNSKLSATDFTNNNKGTSVGKIMVADSNDGLGYSTPSGLATVLGVRYKTTVTPVDNDYDCNKMTDPKVLYRLLATQGTPQNCWSGNFTSCFIVFIGDEEKFGFQLAVAYDTSFMYVRGWWTDPEGGWVKIV